MIKSSEDFIKEAKEQAMKLDRFKDYPKPINASEWLLTDVQKPEQILKASIDIKTKNLVAAPSKKGKSFFLSQMLISIASGKRDFLGYEIIKPCKVLLVNSEINEEHYFHRIKPQIDAMGITSAQLKDNLHIINARNVPKLEGGDKTHPATAERFLDYVAHCAKGMKAEVIALDPIYDFLMSENNPEDWKPLLNFLNKLIEETGAAVIVVHHYGKGDQSSKNPMDRTSGSGVLGRAMDFTFLIDDHEEAELSVVDTVQRNYPKQEKFSVKFWDMVFTIDQTEPKIKSNGNKATGKPQVDDDKALAFFGSGVKPVTSFREYLAKWTSAAKALSKYSELKDSCQIDECYNGKGGMKMVGTPKQIKALREKIEAEKQPIQQKFEVLDAPAKAQC